MHTSEAIKEEDRKLRYLRVMVDLTFNLICTNSMTREEASRHVAGIRGFAMQLFPGKEHVYELVYAPRFKRLLTDKYRLS